MKEIGIFVTFPIDQAQISSIVGLRFWSLLDRYTVGSLATDHRFRPATWIIITPNEVQILVSCDNHLLSVSDSLTTPDVRYMLTPTLINFNSSSSSSLTSNSRPTSLHSVNN